MEEQIDEYQNIKKRPFLDMNKRDMIYNSYNDIFIYMIKCKDPSIKDFYIGSTSDLKNRMNQHKTDCKRSTLKLYRFIREHGGWNNWEFITLYENRDEYYYDGGVAGEQVSYDLKYYYEYKFYNELKPTLNTNPLRKRSFVEIMRTHLSNRIRWIIASKAIDFGLYF